MNPTIQMELKRYRGMQTNSYGAPGDVYGDQYWQRVWQPTPGGASGKKLRIKTNMAAMPNGRS